jgi:hypothetical protein
MAIVAYRFDPALAIWMQFISPIQLIHWNTAGSLKICTTFQIAFSRFMVYALECKHPPS